MKNNIQRVILLSAILVIGIYFLFLALIKAEAFLIPFSMAVLLSMILMPVDLKLRSWGLGKALSIIISDLMLLGFFAGLFLVVAAQVNNVAEKWPQYNEKLQPKIEQLQIFVADKTGISREEQEQRIKKAVESERSMKAVGKAVGSIPDLMVSFGNFLLIFVYIFFLMYYRERFKRSIMKFFPDDKKEAAARTLDNFSRISRQYLFGRFILIIFLSVVYSIGLLISGVPHAVLLSILAAVLSLIPYFGNIIGFLLAFSISLLNGGSLGNILGIAATFTIAQFVESNILEPYVVGEKVNINPPMTLFGVVIGGMVWGLAGMIIAIPALGMLKVLFENIPVLSPLAHAMDTSDDESGEGWLRRIQNRVTGWFKN